MPSQQGSSKGPLKNGLIYNSISLARGIAQRRRVKWTNGMRKCCIQNFWQIYSNEAIDFNGL